MVAANKVAASIMEHFASHKAHGYTQGSGRWGDSTTEYVKVGGGRFPVAGGDRDCSSGIISAYEAAGVPVRDKGATYTGNMKQAFLATGMFEWKPMTFKARRGDVYLNHVNHTAMCVDDSPDKLAEFWLNENGGITGGKKGDQTGGECRVKGYYSFPWDGILHFTGQQKVSYSVTVTAYRLNVREAPGTSSRKVGEFKRGDVLTITHQRPVGNAVWGKTSKGWVHLGRYTKRTVKAASANLNARAGAGTAFKKTGSYKKGERFDVTDYRLVGTSTWGKSPKGWVHLGYTSHA